MNLCFNCGKGSPRELCDECEEMGVAKNRPVSPEEKERVLKAFEESQRNNHQGEPIGRRISRRAKRLGNKKPRKKIKKL